MEENHLKTIEHFSFEPIHFTLNNIEEIIERYSRFKQLIEYWVKPYLNYDRNILVCIMVDDINCWNNCQNPDECIGPCLGIDSILNKLSEIKINPDVLIYESTLKELGLRILKTLPKDRIQYDGNYVIYKIGRKNKINLAYDKSGNKTLLKKNLFGLKPTCPLFSLAWYYFRATYNYGEPVVNDSKIFLKYKLNIKPKNYLLNALPVHYIKNEDEVKYLGRSSNNDNIRKMIEYHINLLPY